MSGLTESTTQFSQKRAVLLSIVLLLAFLLPAAVAKAAPEDLSPLQALGQSQRQAQGAQDQGTQTRPEALAQPDVARILATLLPDKPNPVPALVLQDSQPLTPYLEHLFDPDYSIDVNEAASIQYRHKFEIFAPERMPFFGAPGVTWLRFVLPALQDSNEKLVLDLGSSVPGEPVLYSPSFATGTLEWQETAAKKGIIELPPLLETPQVCFLRVDGIPGFWFSPTILKAQSASEHAGYPWHEATLVALCVVIVFCLLKGLVEPGQWRLWTLLYLAACATQAWSGIPSTMAGYSPRVLASLTTAGLALMLWPHVARHFMRCREASRALDAQFILLCLPGAALTLLPLVPNFQWTARFAQIWPLGMAIFIPGALWACVVGAQNAVRFLIATTIPVLAAIFAILGMRSGFAPDLLQALPHLGIALGAITLLALGQKEVEPKSLAPSMSPDRKSDAFSLDLGEPEPAQVVERPVEEPTPAISMPRGEEAARDHLLSLRERLTDLFAEARLPDDARNAMNGILARTDELASSILRLREEARFREDMKRRMTVVAVTKDDAFFAVLTHVLRRRDCHVRAAKSLEEAVELTREFPAKMYVFEGEFADPSTKGFLKELGELCAKGGILTHFLAYTKDQSTWRSLGNAGFTHALVLPIDDAALFNTLDEFREEEAMGLSPRAHGETGESCGETRTMAIEDLPTLEMMQDARQAGVAAQPGDARKAWPGTGQGDIKLDKAADAGPDVQLDLGGTTAESPRAIPRPAENDTTLRMDMGSDSQAGRPAWDDAQDEPEEIPDLFGFGSSGQGTAGKARDGFDARTGQELAHYVSLARSAFLRKDMKEIGRLMNQVSERAAQIPSVARLAELVLKAARASDATSVRDLLMQLSSSIESRTRTR